MGQFNRGRVTIELTPEQAVQAALKFGKECDFGVAEGKALEFEIFEEVERACNAHEAKFPSEWNRRRDTMPEAMRR